MSLQVFFRALIGFALLALIAPRPGYAVQPISSVSTSPASNSTTGIYDTPGVGTPFLGNLWDVTFDGGDDEIQSVTVGADTFEFVTLADELRLRRGASPLVGNRELLFCRGNPDTPNLTIPCEGSTLTDMKTVLLGRSLNYGTDNIFANRGGTNSSNVERLDYIYKSGISVTDTADLGFIILERGGNDAVKIAPILSVDSSFNPTNFGTLVTIQSSDWGASGINYPAVVFRRDPGEVDYRPSADLGNQNVEGALVTFSDLNISPGQIFYGYALFPADVNNPNLPISSYSTSSTTGLDLIEGGGFFQRDSGTTFIDMLIDKAANDPIAAPGSQVTFTITIENQTLGIGVVDADFSDIFPADLTSIEWTCQAFGSAGSDPDDVDSSCLNGALTDTGSASSTQIEGDQTINDVVDIAIGGRIVYAVTATLSGSATGFVNNTATVTTNTGVTGQTEISSSNNSDTATITVQAPGTSINVDSITFSPTKAATGDSVIITTVVSDPQGEADISSVTFDWFNQGNVLVLNDQTMTEISDSDPNTKTFQFTVNIPDFSSSIGNWRATVTAVDIGAATHTNSALLEVDEPNLTESYKSAINLTSTANNQGDTIEYSVVVSESNGVGANSVRIVDSIPSNTTLVGGSLLLCLDASPPSTCTALTAGVDYTNNSNSTFIDVSGISVPGDGLVKLTFRVTIGFVSAGDLITNRATISTPNINFSRDAADLVVFGPPQGPGAKYLYLSNANSTQDLSRLVPNSTSDTNAINGGSASVSFTLAQIPAELTIPSGTVINIDLLMQHSGNNNENRDVVVELRYGPTGNETLIGTTPEVGIQLDNNDQLELETFVLPALGSDVVIPANSRITLTVANETNEGNRRFIIHSDDTTDQNNGENPAGLDFSQIELTVTPVINVDSLVFRSAPSGGGTVVTNPEPGTTLYVRAVVSDPFGDSDIIDNPTITLTRPPGSGTGTATISTPSSPDDGNPTTRTFEWQVDLPPAGSGTGQRERGNWTVQITAVEGEDDDAGNTRVTHTVAGSFTTLSQPNLSTSTKTVSVSGDADPGDTLTYTITLINSGGQTAVNVSISDTLDPLLTYTTASSTCVNGSSVTVTPFESGGIVTVGGIQLAGGASCTVTINATVGGVIGDTINNTAAITNPNGPSATVIAPTVIVSESQIPVTAEKLLYLDAPGSTNGLTRSNPPSTGITAEIDGGNTSVNFDFTNAITRDVTLENDTATVRLWLNRAGNNNATRGVQVELFYNNGGGFVSMGSQALNIDPSNNPSSPSEHVFSITSTLGAPVILNPNADFRLTVTNTTSQGNRRLQVHQVAAAPYSAAAIPLTNAIEVTELSFWDRSGTDETDDPGCAPGCGTQIDPGIVMSGDTIWVRATVADTFGSFDVNTGCDTLASTTNCPTFTLTDPNSGDKTPGGVNGNILSWLTDPSTSTRQFQVELNPTGFQLEGVWQVEVEASEGLEDTVKDTLLGSFERFGAPALMITKSVSSPNAAPNTPLTYTNNVINNGLGPALSVELTNSLGDFLSLQIFVSGGNWRATTSLTNGYTILSEVFDDGSNGFSYDPSSGTCGAATPANSPCIDSAIRNFRTVLNESVPVNDTFNQLYDARVD